MFQGGVALCLTLLPVLDTIGAFTPQGSFNPTINVQCQPNLIKITIRDGVIGGTVTLEDCGTQVVTQIVNDVKNFFGGDCMSGSIPADGVPALVTITESAVANPIVDQSFTITCVNGEGVVVVNPTPTDGVLEAEICPLVTMEIYDSGTLTAFTTGVVGDPVDLVVQLVSFHRDDYDIVVDRLTANTVPLMDTGCTLMPTVIPTFTKISQGVLETSFNMIRPSVGITSGPMNVLFEASITICLGPCVVGTCPGGEDARGRKKRNLEDDSNIIYTISVLKPVTVYSADGIYKSLEYLVYYSKGPLIDRCPILFLVTAVVLMVVI